MPDHLHVLILGLEVASRPRLAMNRFKQRSGDWLAANRSDVVWQGDFYDRIVRQKEGYENVARYIALNPVARGWRRMFTVGRTPMRSGTTCGRSSKTHGGDDMLTRSVVAATSVVTPVSTTRVAVRAERGVDRDMRPRRSRLQRFALTRPKLGHAPSINPHCLIWFEMIVSGVVYAATRDHGSRGYNRFAVTQNEGAERFITAPLAQEGFDL